MQFHSTLTMWDAQKGPVKGCKVKGEKLTKVPTGFVLPDGTEVEDGNMDG